MYFEAFSTIFSVAVWKMGRAEACVRGGRGEVVGDGERKMAYELLLESAGMFVVCSCILLFCLVYFILFLFFIFVSFIFY